MKSKSLVSGFLASAARFALRPALVVGAETLTYRELLGRANPRFISWLRSGFLNRVQFLPLYFRIHDELRGWSLTRIYKTASGCEANIIELFAPHVGADIYAWMVAETVSAIASHRPDVVYAGASLPVLQQALRRNGFYCRGSQPMHVRWIGPGDFVHPICLTNNTADEALLPYPTD